MRQPYVLLNHVVARTPAEWKKRFAEGYHAKQWKFLQRLVEEYDDYLECRALNSTFRQHRGGEFSTDVASAYCGNVNRRLRRLHEAPKERGTKRQRSIEPASKNVQKTTERAVVSRLTSADSDTSSQDQSEARRTTTASAGGG